MSRPAEIRIFLVDGEPHGIRTAELSNWTGKALVAPRGKLPKLGTRGDEVRRTGVYILTGDDPEKSERKRVYVGEGERIWDRIYAHDKDESKDFWDTVYLFISKDSNLTKAHIRWLESRLINLAYGGGKSEVHNGTNPDPPLLPEPEVASMEHFLDNMKMMLPVLGCPLFEPRATIRRRIPEPIETADEEGTTQTEPGEVLNPSELSSGDEIFTLTAGPIRVQAVATSRGTFIVPRGTKAKRNVGASSAYQNHRKRMIESGILVDSEDPEFYEFSEDYEFNHPTPAVCVIRGGRMNGHYEWKLASDPSMNYGDWKDHNS